MFCDLFGTTRFIIFYSGWHIFKLLGADAVSVVCEQSAVLWCVVVFCDPLGIRRRFFLSASERFGRSLTNRTHKNDMKCLVVSFVLEMLEIDFPIRLFMRD